MSATKKSKRACMDEPDTLFDLAMRIVVQDTAAVAGSGIPRPVGRAQEISLPIEVWERFLAAYQKCYRVDDNIAQMLSDSKSRLRTARLRRGILTDRGLEQIMLVKPRELELVECQQLTTDALQHITNNSENLTALTVVHTNIMSEEQFSELMSLRLHRLTLRLRGQLLTVDPAFTCLSTLTHLELSQCECKVLVTQSIGKLENLQTLILHSVPGIQRMLNWIAMHSNLQHLDISQASDRLGVFFSPSIVLSRLVLSLPLLSRLDISGTNLAGSGAAREEGGPPEAKCDIPGLASRVDKPLAFLGLYGTHHAACKRHDIPALLVSGDANEEQVLTAAAAYMDRPEVLTRVLNDLYYLFRYEDNRQVSRALQLVLDAMEHHITEKTVQISGSATLFYIVKDKEMECMTARTKRRVISALLMGMEAHIDDETMMRNGCLGLTRFNIPSDVLFQYERMATVLLTGVLDFRLEDFVRRMGIYLLNSLACQVDSQHKQFLGKIGAIGMMVNIISERMVNNTCDAMLEMAWSTLWNMTDEMPENCERFLKLNGLHLFLSCLKSFPNNDDQLRNMMGLLGNVAENPPLRRDIMTPRLLKVFHDLLNSSRDGIEVSYNAGGVLAHILSDGAELWTASEPAREEVLERLEGAIESWDLKAERNINYRSFRPILSLLRAHHTPQCQHWAAWALANLTTVYPDKYCKLIESEGGLELLESVCQHEAPYERVKELCSIVIENVTKAQHTQKMDE